MFQISVVNRTLTISDLELHRVVRAINRQIAEDFAPYWGFGGRLRAEGPTGERLDAEAARELRGDGILYLLDSTSSTDALGFHDRTLRGIPYGLVFLDLCAKLGDAWSATLSHEALELIADPQCNLLVHGPHPRDPSLPNVYHYFEMCDAVQSQVYEIDSVVVSNFVLPSYFAPNDANEGRRDFSGTNLCSFGVNPGGYIGYFDPNVGHGGSDAIYLPDDRSRERFDIKSSAQPSDLDRRFGRVMRRGGSPAASAQPQGLIALRAGSKIEVASRPPNSDPIRHLVVLMLENRSFDQVLGGLADSIAGLDGVAKDNPRTNRDTLGNVDVEQKPVARAVISPTFDAPHEYSDVMEQIRNGNAGFVNSYVKRHPTSSQDDREQVMAYFPEDGLPVTHALAKNFLVCNRWFSSLPGPTWPNRLLAHSGTSLGHVLMPDADNPGEMAQVWRTFTQDTIYDRLDDGGEAGQPLSWRIYHDGVPQSVIMDHLKHSIFSRDYAPIERFAEDAQQESTFPSYVFIEPRYADGWFGKKATDQHPPASMTDGEALIAYVYNALRRSEVWNSTLLVLTYDEHGGFYDHVTPPAAIPPDDNKYPFGFDRLGVRVPAILISPWVAQGCDNNVYDHTSILRYLIEKHGLRPLGARTAASTDPRAVSNFADRLLQTPRTDTLEVLPESAEFVPMARMGERPSSVPQAPTAPDNTRRALLAIGERLRAEDRRAVYGVRVTDAVIQSPPPVDAETFGRRIDALDDWLAQRASSAPRPMRAVVQTPGLLNGIDVYAGTGDIDWVQVKQSGITFAYLRAAYGVDTDKAVVANLKAARAAGLVCGVYHFLRTSQNYDKQIQVMLGLLDRLGIGPGDLPPAVDIEDNPAYDGPWDPSNNDAFVKAVKRWIDAVKGRINADPVVYTRAGFWTDLGNPAGFQSNPLWVASYRPDHPTLPTGWSRFTFWQYSESGKVEGIANKVDLNYFAGSRDTLEQFLLGAGQAAPEAHTMAKASRRMAKAPQRRAS
jgi:phospholipase C/GH25 family lysozyme M1 (1,4-beta-N-acetylmuramidase)